MANNGSFDAVSGCLSSQPTRVTSAIKASKAMIHPFDLKDTNSSSLTTVIVFPLNGGQSYAHNDCKNFSTKRLISIKEQRDSHTQGPAFWAFLDKFSIISKAPYQLPYHVPN